MSAHPFIVSLFLLHKDYFLEDFMSRSIKKPSCKCKNCDCKDLTDEKYLTGWKKPQKGV